jgi:hypothetical protein
MIHIHSFIHSSITDAIKSLQTEASLTHLQKKDTTGETDAP